MGAVAERHSQELAKVRPLAVEGLSYTQIDRKLGFNKGRTRALCLRYEVEVPGKSRQDGYDTRADRTQAMASMYRQGLTLEVIAKKYGITRERVRQVIRKTGVTAEHGGQALVVGMKRDAKAAAARRRVEGHWGIPFELWQELRPSGTIRAFEQQRKGSANRGILFSLTFAQWYAIWQASGKLHLRGRGLGKYCMSRIGDSGGYEVGNVHIQLNTANASEGFGRRRGVVKEYPGVFCIYPGRDLAWLAKVGKERLGFFATVELAAAARAARLAELGVIDAGRGRLGTGSGWTLIKGRMNKPYQVQVIGTPCTYHPTPEEARAEYLRRCAEVAAQRAHVPAALTQTTPAVQTAQEPPQPQR